MNFRQIINDDEAVSPVIGVILMVAITVILAAVIGTFVLGLGDQVSNTAPQASFTFDQSTVDYEDTDGHPASLKSVEITHDGGDQISESQLSVKVNGNQAVDIIDNGATTNDKGEAPYDGSSEIGAGSTVEIDAYYIGSDLTNDIPTGANAVGYASGANDNNIDAPQDGTNDLLEPLAADDNVRVTWQSSNGGDSATLGTFTVE